MSLTLATSEQPNIAPERGLQQSMSDRKADSSVLVEADWFLQTRKKLEQEDSPTWDSQNLLWALIFHMTEGRQLLRRAKYGRGWRPVSLPESTDSPVYSLNIIGFYSDNIKAKWTQSNTDVVWRAVSDADSAQGSAKAATKVHEYYQRRLYTQNFRQIEATLAQCGKYARYYYYTDEVKSYARRPKYGTEQVGFGEGSVFCADCGMGGELGGLPGRSDGGAIASPARAADQIGGGVTRSADELTAIRGAVEPTSFGTGGDDLDSSAIGMAADQGQLPVAGTAVPACPHCGSPNVEVTQSEPLEVETLQGYEEYESGDIVCEPVPAFELKHDLTLSPQDSPYLIRRRRVRTAVLESKFDFLKIRPAQSDNVGLQAEDNLKKATYGSGTNYTAAGDSGDEDSTDFVQVWLDPCLYSRQVLKESFRTLDGNEIPAGTRLTDLFPDGLYMCFVEGVEGCVELRNECHKDYWVGQVYRIRANSSLGTGIEDMVEGQRQYNLVNSVIFTMLRSSALPATLYDQRLLPGGTSAYLGSLKNIPVEMGAIEGKRLQDSVYQLSPQAPTPAHFSYAQQLDYFSQKASRVTDFSGGLPGVDNSTATGAQIAAANSQSLFGPQLALKAEVDRIGAELILRMFKKYCFDERYVSLSGKRGEMDGQWLKAADIDVELFAEVVAESYLPQTNMERRERWQGFLTLIGGVPGYEAMRSQNPALVEQLSELFDVDTDGDDYTSVAELCNLRIGQMTEAVPMLQVAMQGMPPMQMAADPMTGEMMVAPVDPVAEAGQFLLGILQPPIEPEELGHMAAINYCRNWLTTDEGREAPPELRAGVKAMIYAHVEGLMAEAQLTGMLGVAGDPMAQMAMTQPMDADGQKDALKNKNPQPSQMGGGKKMPRKSTTDAIVKRQAAGAPV